MCDIFENRNISYNLSFQTDFTRLNINTSNFEIDSLKYLSDKSMGYCPM